MDEEKEVFEPVSVPLPPYYPNLTAMSLAKMVEFVFGPPKQDKQR